MLPNGNTVLKIDAKVQIISEITKFFREKCNFGFAESTFARKCSNIFGILLAYSYLCTQINDLYGN